MALLNIINLTHSHGDLNVLNRVNLTLNQGDKVGLVGRNGSGKTTLMNIITGDYPPDFGQTQLARGTKAGYLPQDPKLTGHHTLRHEAGAAFKELTKLHDQLDDLTHKMAEPRDDKYLAKLMTQYEKIEHSIHTSGGYAIDHRIDAMLHALGLTDDLFNVEVANLSGGQKARLAMTKLLLTQPDVLLLDEPTNHLDIQGRQWLEQFLKSYPGAVLLISHDRWLLDEVVTKIVALEHTRLSEYPGNYHAYRKQHATRLLEQKRTHDKQQTYIRHQRQYIQRYKTGQRAKEARGREKKLQRFIEKEMLTPSQELAAMNLQLPKATRTGEQVISAINISKAYDDNILFPKTDITITRAQRIGIIGPNGCGKSTLANILLKQLQSDTGTVRLGTNVDLGYYHQTHEYLNDTDTPVTYLQKHTPETSEQNARDIAGAFLFSGTDQDKPFAVLSGGERTRAVLAGLVIGAHNLLVLDEPSNHLDIPSAERLEEALKQFDGTLILITHDRMLLQDTVNELLIFDTNTPGSIKHFYGTYADYLAEQKKKPNQPVSQQSAKFTIDNQKPARPQLPKQTSRPTQTKHNKYKSPFGRLNDTQLETKINETETQLTQLGTQLADPELYRDHKRFSQIHDQHQSLAATLTNLENEWLRRTDD